MTLSHRASLAAWPVAGTWLIHGLYNKLLHGSPRHLAIVQSTPGLHGLAGERVLMVVGIGEVLIAAWVLSARMPRLCAGVQTAALLSMNAVELTFARHLLLWPAGLLPVNVLFLAMAWIAAESQRARTLTPTLRTKLRRHPIPIEAHFRHCLALTYAAPADILRPMLPPGLELETVDNYGFVAVALVQTESLRPSGCPTRLGQSFFLAGYRVFATFQTADGKRLRGLRILRSDADRLPMVVGGNLLTHYNYHRCRARVDADARQLSASVRTADSHGDLDIAVRFDDSSLPPGSPFRSLRQARRFAGPLPFTFDYEDATHAIVAIEARRTHWMPAPVSVDVDRIAFFEQPEFKGCRPILAAAFHMPDVDYHWERGVTYPLTATAREVAS